MIILAKLYWVLILVVTTFNKPEASEKLRNVSIIKIRVVNTDKSPITGESSTFLIVITNQLFAVNFSFLLAHLFWVLAYLAWGRLSMLRCHRSIPHLHPTSCCNRLSEVFVMDINHLPKVVANELRHYHQTLPSLGLAILTTWQQIVCIHYQLKNRTCIRGAQRGSGLDWPPQHCWVHAEMVQAHAKCAPLGTSWQSAVS